AEGGATAEAATPATAGLAPAQEEAAAGSVPTEAPAATPALAVPAQATATAVAGGFENTGDEIDDEIREVFLEEFAEEIDNLDRLLPPWRAQPDDMERLLPIRRVFHTLKGSGRLVGARTLGEFCWKIENMLNQVRDGKRQASPAVVAVVDQAFYTLPELLAALHGSAPVTSDLAAIQEAADRVAAGAGTMPVFGAAVRAPGGAAAVM